AIPASRSEAEDAARTFTHLHAGGLGRGTHRLRFRQFAAAEEEAKSERTSHHARAAATARAACSRSRYGCLRASSEKSTCRAWSDPQAAQGQATQAEGPCRARRSLRATRSSRRQ